MDPVSERLTSVSPREIDELGETDRGVRTPPLTVASVAELEVSVALLALLACPDLCSSIF